MDDLETKGRVIDVASQVNDPASGKNLVDAHIVEEVEVNGGRVGIRLLLPKGTARELRWNIEDALGDALEAAGIKGARISTFIEGAEPAPSAPAPAHAHDHGHDHGHDHSHDHGHDHSHAHGAAQPGGGAAGRPASTTALKGVGRVIAVASGKGGVGKSTVAVNLALALRRLGFTVGLLDVDVYGPSLPVLLGVNERPNVLDKRIIPVEAHGMKLMSLGFLMDDDTPVIWRGPIVTGIIRQFLQDVDWGGTDYLIVDMPPGTGDAQLSLAQTVPVDGAVVVTTPSDLSLVDAARGLRMFNSLNVDVIGIVENMSWYEWPGLAAARAVADRVSSLGGGAPLADELRRVLEEHGRVYLFGQDGGRREAERLETAFLGQIPLDGAVRAGGDAGNPIVAKDPEGAVAQAFVALAQRVTEAKPLEAKEKKKGLFSFFKG